MENKNKCFFSISLKNGIIITGNSPLEVFDYLANLRIAVKQAEEDEMKNDANSFWLKQFKEMKDELFDAIITIHKSIRIGGRKK